MTYLFLHCRSYAQDDDCRAVADVVVVVVAVVAAAAVAVVVVEVVA